MSTLAAQKLRIKIFSPYQVYFQGEAVTLSARNRSGPFDILPGHVNFLSLLTSGKVTIDTGYQTLQFEIDRGLIRVNRNVVTLFANI